MGWPRNAASSSWRVAQGLARPGRGLAFLACDRSPFAFCLNSLVENSKRADRVVWVSAVCLLLLMGRRSGPAGAEQVSLLPAYMEVEMAHHTTTLLGEGLTTVFFFLVRLTTVCFTESWPVLYGEKQK